jgi:amino acid transporter
VLAGFIVYTLQIVLMGGAADRSSLQAAPYAVLVGHALLGAGFLVVAGMFSASLSSALSSFTAAPRVIQAIARDRLLRPLNLFSKGTPGGDEPRQALTLVFGLTLATLWLATGETAGDGFNQVAAWVTMCFLCTYLIMNLAAFVEAFGSNPSFRPRFRWFHWSTALTGAAGCFLAMLWIDPVNAVLAVVAIALLYVYISRQACVIHLRRRAARFSVRADCPHLHRLNRHHGSPQELASHPTGAVGQSCHPADTRSFRGSGSRPAGAS